MAEFSGMESLRELTNIVPTLDDYLSLMVGHEFSHNYWKEGNFCEMTMETAIGLLAHKTSEIFGREDIMGFVASSMVLLAPMAKDLDDLTKAISELGAWAIDIMESGAVDQLAELINEGRMHESRAIDMAGELDEAQCKFHAEKAAECYEMVNKIGQFQTELAGNPAGIMIDQDGICIIYVHQDEVYILGLIPHQEGNGGWGGGGDDPDPVIDPSMPELENA